MKFINKLIPRFNIDYNFEDFISSFYPNNRFNKGNELKKIFGDRDFLFTNNGRSALYMILKSLGIPKGSKIGVPLYSCSVVFDAIVKAGLTPVFIDIDLENYTIDPLDLEKKIENLKAVVIIHTFGRPADMNQIKNIAGAIPIIEDCAHSLLSEYNGKQTGTLGFASFFSLTKYLSNGGGGMILLNNDFSNELKKKIDSLGYFNTISEIKDAFVTYLYSFLYHRPWFGLFTYPIGFSLRTIVNHDEGIKDFKVKKIRKTDFNLLLRKLSGLEKKIELQRNNSFFLIKELKDTSLILPYEMKNTYCNYYLFPIRFHNKKEREKAHEYLRDMGIDTAKLYSETPIKSKRFYGYKGDCSNSEIVADTILIIPNYYTLNETDLIKIADGIKKIERLL